MVEKKDGWIVDCRSKVPADNHGGGFLPSHASHHMRVDRGTSAAYVLQKGQLRREKEVAAWMSTSLTHDNTKPRGDKMARINRSAAIWRTSKKPFLSRPNKKGAYRPIPPQTNKHVRRLCFSSYLCAGHLVVARCATQLRHHLRRLINTGGAHLREDGQKGEEARKQYCVLSHARARAPVVGPCVSSTSLAAYMRRRARAFFVRQWEQCLPARKVLTTKDHRHFDALNCLPGGRAP